MTMPRKNSRERSIYKFVATLSNQSGFTLVELIVICAILGVLASLAIPVYSSNVDKAKNTRAISDLREIEREIQAYFMENNAIPTGLNKINRDTLKDPWGTLYIYTPNPLLADALKGTFPLALNRSLDYDLYSKGSNRDSTPIYDAQKCDDDIVRASDGSYIGLRSKF